MQDKIITWVTIIIAAAILIFLVIYLNHAQMDTIDETTCFNSVVARNNALVRGEILQMELYPLKCKTKDIEIDNTDVDDIKTKVVESMYSCWSMLGRGKMNFLKDDAYVRLTYQDADAEKAACLVCSTIHFGEKAQEKNVEVDISQYAQTHKIPDANITYLSYFSNSEGGAAIETSQTSEKMNPITTGKDYAIIYMSVKGGKLGQEVARNIAPSIAVAVVAGVGLAVITVASGGTLAPLAIVAIGAGVGALFGAAGTASGYLEKVNAVNMYCDKDLKGCNYMMVVPLTEESFAKCPSFANIP